MRNALRFRYLIWATGLAWVLACSAADRSAEQLVTERCQNCHGLHGQSSSPLYPKLAGQNAEYLQRQLFNFRLGRRDSVEMKQQVADLTGNEVEALAQYFSQSELIPDIAFDPAQAAIGRDLYLKGNPDTGVTACVVCHGPRARGGLFLPRLAGQHASYIERQLTAFVAESHKATQMVMHSVVSALSEKEIVALGQYLSGLE